MKTERLTTAQALIRFIDNQYISVDGAERKFVKGVWCIFGHGNVLGIGQALEELNHDLALHHGRNEQGMVHAATGYAKQKNRREIYACTSSVGPGAANMVTGAATATANRIPVLLLPGDTFATRQPDPVLQQLEHSHEIDISTNDAFKAVCTFWDRINRPEQIMLSLINAFRILTDPEQTGAVCIALPQDVQCESYDFPASFLAKRIHHIERKYPTPTSVSRASAGIANARKPMLICGGGVKYADAADAFIVFAEKHNIPFGETQAGKGAVVSTHPLNLGGIGTTGTAAANQVAADADCIIGVGTRYGDFTTASKWLFRDAQIISINVSRFDVSKLDAIGIEADAKIALSQLSESLGEYVRTDSVASIRDAWFKERDRLFHETETEKSKLISHVHSFSQVRALGILNTALPKDAVVVGSAGSLPGDLQRIWSVEQRGGYHLEYAYSCMGYEISAAVGVALAEKRPVYAFVGDGSYLMLHSELLTAGQEGIRLHIVLFDNTGFGCINNLQTENGMGSFLTEFAYTKQAKTQTSRREQYIDFARCAEAYGCVAYTITTEDELRAALADAPHHKQSVLFDIKVHPKTMTSGYDAWWHVAIASETADVRTQDIYNKHVNVLSKARKY